MRLLKTLFTIILGVVMQAQENIHEGFHLLEKGRFTEAEYFFKNYLEKHPDNRSAQICYGRALGLNGSASQANTYFLKLMELYGEDLELRLNYSESLLWSGAYNEAEPFYQELVTEFPENFTAHLGYANTLANLGKHVMGLEAIRQALEIDPENPGARTSKKYILLGYAEKLAQKQQYKKGISILDSIFDIFPGDLDANLAKANTYLRSNQFELAKSTFLSLGTTKRDTIIGLLGIALTEHLNGNQKDALKFSEKAKAHPAVVQYSDLAIQAWERYIQALIWNKKYRKARKLLEDAPLEYHETKQILALRAMLQMYVGNSLASLEQYNKILERDSVSFDGNLGSANALFASDRTIEAYSATLRTLDYFDGQKDAMALLLKLNNSFVPTTLSSGTYSFDNGGNSAYTAKTALMLPLSTGFQTAVTYHYRQTDNSDSERTAQTHSAEVNGRLKLMPKFYVNVQIGIIQSWVPDNSFSRPLYKFELDLKPYRLQRISAWYQSQIQDFNTDLLTREIVMDHFGVNYNLGTHSNLGWFTQLMYTRQSDQNVRNSIFSSVYYTLPMKVKIKTGINYQYLSFAEQVPNIYFSPSYYNAYEVFTDLNGKIGKKLRISANLAAGIQKVENESNSALFRSELSLQYGFSRRLSVNAFGAYSNLASATAAGFQFTRLGVQVNWKLKSKPIFYNRLKDIANR